MRTDAHATALLHVSNLGEIQAGSLAQSRAQNADVRTFAAQMVRAHTQLDQQGQTLAASLGLSPMLPDSTLPRMQMEEMRMLNSTGSGSGTSSGAATTTPNAAGATPTARDTSAAGIPGGTSNAPTTRANQAAVSASAGGSMSGATSMGGASAQSFDVAYMSSQVADHQRTLAIVDAAISQAQNAQLRTALETQVRPAVAEHLQMAQQILQRLGGR